MSVAISNIRLVDARVQVGPALTTLGGYADDMFTVSPASDVGALFSGAVGDVLLVNRVQNAWLLSVTMNSASTGITTINVLHSTLGVWPINIAFGAWNLQGYAILINTGELAAGLSANTRTMQIGVAKVSGNTDTAPGTVLQVL
jgi:hypothetical protein